MKAIFFVLALFCAVYASEEEQDIKPAFERLVDPHREAVKNVLEDVSEFEARMHEKIELEATLLKSEAMLEIENNLKETLEEIRDTITVTGGEDSEKCYEAAKLELNTLSGKANEELEKCVETALNTIKEPFTKIAVVTETGRTLLEDFDKIVPECESSSYIRTRGCVLTKVNEARRNVRDLQSKAKYVKRSITAAAIVNRKEAQGCMDKVQTNVRIGITEVTVNAGTCIRTN